jgi:thiamine pyrophosphate-dependent acetolactate synthase large subunit-like protein
MSIMREPISIAPKVTESGIKVSGNVLLARALRRQNVDIVFFLMGGPMGDVESLCATEGIRMVDVRHEQAAALAAQAYARVRSRPGVCMACSGPGAINLTNGLANALIDCAPVVALGGSSPVEQYGKDAFQEIDQVAIMRPVTKWAERVYETKRIPELVDRAFREAMSGKPGPVYLDFPGDVLYRQVDESEVEWPPLPASDAVTRTAASAVALDRAVAMLRSAKQPLIVSGSGILWSQASAALADFVELTGIPFYTTPQGRGVIPEDSHYFYGHARTTAMREADLVIVLGTRLNYVFGFGKPPRFSPTAKWIRVDIDQNEIGKSAHLELPIAADVKTVLTQLSAALDGQSPIASYATWRDRLEKIEMERRPKTEARLANDQVPIHPLRLCKEIREFIDRDAILCVDGHEILTFGRQTIPSFVPGHRLNSGPFGMMGVGLPFGLGAKAADPSKQVVVLHGDGSFGLNGMEIDSAMRNNLPLLVIISLNGGWTADPKGTRQGSRLGYTRYDKLAEALGCHGEFVEHPDQIRGALERANAAVKNGQCALVNVVTDAGAAGEGTAFSVYRAV